MKTFNPALIVLAFASPLALAACAESADPPTEAETPTDSMMGEDTGDTAPVTDPDDGAMPAEADYGEDGMQGAPPVEDSEGLDPKDIPEDGNLTGTDDDR